MEHLFTVLKRLHFVLPCRFRCLLFRFNVFFVSGTGWIHCRLSAIGHSGTGADRQQVVVGGRSTGLDVPGCRSCRPHHFYNSRHGPGECPYFFWSIDVFNHLQTTLALLAQLVLNSCWWPLSKIDWHGNELEKYMGGRTTKLMLVRRLLWSS